MRAAQGMATEAANARVAAEYAGPDEVSDHERRSNMYRAELRDLVDILAAAADHADRLAARLKVHAFCPTHPRSEADPRNCPHCDDRAAYDAYALAAGIKPDPPYTGKTINIHDLHSGRTP